MAELTCERLDEIEKRAKAATQGPWESGEWVRIKARYVSEICAAGGLVVVADTDKTALAVDDLAFVAAAREDVPALVTALRRAWLERDEARSDLEWKKTLLENVRRLNETVLDGLERCRAVIAECDRAFPEVSRG